jgi:ArpU family phage transcriptional regulator
MVNTKLDKLTFRKLEELLRLSVFLKSTFDDEIVVNFDMTEASQHYDARVHQRKIFVQAVEQAVGKLPQEEKKLVTERYMNNESLYLRDHDVIQSMEISRTSYVKIRQRAFEKLAMTLDITQSKV